MIRIYVLIIVLVLVLLGLRWFLKTSPEVLASYIRRLVLIVAGLLVLYLAATGRLNGLFALFGLAIAFIIRFLPVLLRYAPYLQKLWFLFQHNKASGAGSGTGGATQGGMSVNEAYDILGLKPGASTQEITMAHKRLMQKNHPDRGGSDYLASRINQAKDILLK